MLIKKQDLLSAIEITKVGYEDLKPSLAHLRVADGFGWATDGHRIIKFPVIRQDGNSTDEIFIHFNSLKAILKRGKPVKVKGCNHYSVNCEDVTVDPGWKYPDLAALLPQSKFIPISLEFRGAIDNLLQQPLLRVVEFKVTGGRLYTASHSGRGGLSTYPLPLQSETIAPEAAAELFETSIAFNQGYLFDLLNTPFDGIAIHHGAKLGQFHVRHSVTGHESLLMAVELQNSRSRAFAWPEVSAISEAK